MHFSGFMLNLQDLKIEKYLLQSLVQEKNILCDRGTCKIQT